MINIYDLNLFISYNLDEIMQRYLTEILFFIFLCTDTFINA